MSLLSRNSGGGRRRVATMATVFVGTLLTYLVVTAVPAFAQTTCVAGPNVGQVILNVGTDDVVILAPVGAEIQVSENGGILGPCPGVPITIATTDWLDIRGSNAGNESVTIYDTENVAWAEFTTTFNGGNGNDTLVFENGAIPANPAGFAGLPDAGPFFTNMRQAGSAVAVDIAGTNTSAEVRIDNAETIRVGGSGGNDGLCASRTVAFGASCDVDLLTQTGGTASADDNIALPATAPVSQGLTLNGAAGLDVLASGNGNDIFLGGPGSDAVSYEASGAAVTVDLAAGTATGMGTDTLTDVQDVAGSLRGDTLLGNSLDNNIFGDDGNDTIDGREGNDGGTAGAIVGLLGLEGGDGDDTLSGGTGTDIVEGQSGDDVVNEGAAANGADTLSGGTGGETAGDTLDYSARTTNTVVRAGAGAVSGQDANNDGDAADAGDENDTVGADFETYATGSGNDTLVGVVGASPETFVPGAGNDSVDGNGGTDMLDQSDAPGAVTFNLETGTSTGHGNDTFVEVETFASGAGDDVVIPDIQTGLPAGFDWFANGGIDLIDGSTNTGGFTVDLSVLGGPAGCKPTGLCIDVENATGGSGNDSLTGSAISNVLIGGAGFDIISAGGGNDFVEGGAGNDTLTGGTGADFLSYVNAPSGEVIDLQLGFASGGDGDDAIGFFEIVLGSDFNDQITGGQGTTFDVNLRIRGRRGNDLITGSSSNDTLAGGGGNDVIRGSAGDDILRGAAGNDRLFGSSGDDFLFGGRGTDRGRGGPGDDICRGVEDRRSC